VISSLLVNGRAEGEAKYRRAGNRTRCHDDGVGAEFGIIAVCGVSLHDAVDENTLGNVGHVHRNGVSEDEAVYITGDGQIYLIGEDRPRDDFTAVLVAIAIAIFFVFVFVFVFVFTAVVIAAVVVAAVVVAAVVIAAVVITAVMITAVVVATVVVATVVITAVVITAVVIIAVVITAVVVAVVVVVVVVVVGFTAARWVLNVNHCGGQVDNGPIDKVNHQVIPKCTCHASGIT
jgi:hypothetical protein